LFPAGVCAQIQQEGTESNAYQESYQKQIVTPYQQESFQQNQFSYGIPSSRRPTFKNFHAAEQRAYSSREEMRRDKELKLQRKLLKAELKQRQQDFLLSQQAGGLEGYGQGEGNPFGEFVQPGPPIIVNNQNNTQVIIKLGEDKDGNLVPISENSEGPINSDVTVVQEGTGNNTLVDIQK